MTVLPKNINPWLCAVGSILLLAACTSNAPAPKAPTGESANGSEGGPGSAKSSEKDKADIVEEDTGDEATPTTKASSTEGKDKAAANKSAAAAPVDDSRTTESIRKIIDANRPKFKKCYEAERKKVPDLKGTVVLQLTMDADGKSKVQG